MKLIGIFGTGRNGSTLLTRLLDGIPQTYTHPFEVNFLSAMNDLAQKGRVSRAVRMNATIKPLNYLTQPVKTSFLMKRYHRHIVEMEDMYINQLENKSGLNSGEHPFPVLNSKAAYLPSYYVEEFLKGMAKWINSADNDINHYIFKTIETPYVEDYEKLFPDMKFLHLIRNPLDVYSSQKRTLMYKGKGLWYLGGDALDTMIMKRWIPHAKIILDKKTSKRHYMLRYEDLINNPLDTMKKICAWLELPLPLYPTKQTVLGGRFLKELPPSASEKGIRSPLDVVADMRSKFSYTKVMADCERELIVYLTYKYARAFGYFSNISLPKRRDILKKWIMPKKWEFMNSRNILQISLSLMALFERRVSYFTNLYKTNEQ